MKLRVSVQLLFGLVLLMGCAAQAAPPITVAPPPATAAPPSPTLAPEPSLTADSSLTPAQAAAAQAEFLPQATSVWNTTIGPDTMTGACAASVLPVYGLVQITPKDGEANEIEWKSQEPKPYVMAKVKPNTYTYSGPTSINDGTVTMTVIIVDDKSLAMVREFVSSKEPGCTHQHDYAGEFKWTR